MVGAEQKHEPVHSTDLRNSHPSLTILSKSGSSLKVPAIRSIQDVPSAGGGSRRFRSSSARSTSIRLCSIVCWSDTANCPSLVFNSQPHNLSSQFPILSRNWRERHDRLKRVVLQNSARDTRQFPLPGDAFSRQIDYIEGVVTPCAAGGAR